MLHNLLILLKLWLDRHAWQHDLTPQRENYIQKVKELKK